MKEKNRRISAVALLSAAVVGSIFACKPPSTLAQSPNEVPRIYYQENFQNYRTTAPTAIKDKGVTLFNDPIFSSPVAAVNINLAEEAFVLSPTPQVPQGAGDYDVLFKFRLQGKDEPGRFALYLQQTTQSGKNDIMIDVASTTVSVSSKGVKISVLSEAKLSAEIEKNIWQTAAATVRGDTLKFYLNERGKPREIAAVKIPVATATSVNFHGYKEAAFSLTDLVVRSPGKLPHSQFSDILPAPKEADTSSFKKDVTETVSANDVFGATLLSGIEAKGAKITLNWSEGKPTEIALTAKSTFEQQTVRKEGKNVREKKEYQDTVIHLSGVGGRNGLDYHIRPLLQRYNAGSKEAYWTTDDYWNIRRNWDSLPRASEHPVKVDFRKTVDGVALYLDGNLAGNIKGTDIKSAVFTVSGNASVGNIHSSKDTYDAQKYIPLDVASQRMAKSFAGASASLNPGLQTIKEIPFDVVAATDSADIGLVQQGVGNRRLETDEYLSRTPFDGFLSEIHFTVPGGAPYSYAWVLCAVDPDTLKTPTLTARITRYVRNGVGGNLIADTTVTLPRDGNSSDADATEVGTVTHKTSNGNNIELPLYLVKMPLKSGQIIDQFSNESLSFEFLGKLDGEYQQRSRTMKPDPNSTSAVQIFGATLERSPVGMTLTQSQPGNIFANNDKPETTVNLQADAPSSGKLVWTISDVNGREVKTDSASYNFSKIGEEKSVTLPLAMPELGWYQLDIKLQDNAGNTFFTHPASFALLGQDLRKAKYDSPYGVWWFDGAHNTPKDINFAGPIMFKAGIRKAGWTKHSEEEMAQWYITTAQLRDHFKRADKSDPEKAKEQVRKQIEADLKKWPHVKEVLIFHEAGPRSSIPMELLGYKPENPSPRSNGDILNLAGQFYRENFPQLKLTVGNSNIPAATITAALRNGGNADYIDYIGLEAASQTFKPETLNEYNLQGMHIAQDAVKVLSGRDVPFSGTFEFTFRTTRDLGAERQAQFYTRDVLISLANKLPTIAPAILFDVSNSYYNTLWGASGLLERGPFGYPKRSYVAYATLTNVLDQVSSPRQILTGSTTVYAVEYDRADQKFATSLWAARGFADFNIEFEKETPVQIIDIYGRSRDIQTKDGKVTVNAGESPSYIIADTKIKSITLSNRTFPEDQMRARQAKVAAPLDDVTEVRLDMNKDLDDSNLKDPQEYTFHLPIRQAGQFDLQQAQDEEKGNALELRLDRSHNPNLSKYITEYTTIRLKNPAPVEGKPAAVGVWIKGNSNHGKVMFEIEDAQGEVWRSIATSGWGVDVLDWPGRLTVDFDGWNFIAFPLRETSLFTDRSPGPVSDQWVSSGGDKEIQYPIKVRAIIVDMNRKPLHLTGFTDASSAIRLRDVSGIYESEK